MEDSFWATPLLCTYANSRNNSSKWHIFWYPGSLQRYLGGNTVYRVELLPGGLSGVQGRSSNLYFIIMCHWYARLIFWNKTSWKINKRTSTRLRLFDNQKWSKTRTRPRVWCLLSQDQDETMARQIFQISNILGRDQAWDFWKNKQKDGSKTKTYQ